MAKERIASRTAPPPRAVHSASVRQEAPPRALVCDPDAQARRTVSDQLHRLGCVAAQAASGKEALRILRAHPIDLAFLDSGLERESGPGLAGELLAERPGLHLVLVSASPDVNAAVEAIRSGAADYLVKPLSRAQLGLELERVRERRRADPRLTAGAGDAAPVLGGWFSAEEIEKEHVRRVLAWAGSLEEAAQVLGVAVTTLWRKRKRWAL
ncbi:MAG TPA: response regulator [Anaeromyxobacteraceae bacterium]|jgi:DNA-binding response OmpR family regulator|nr:response regulator [Anaeromyxobacteraceae bacterium]